MTHELLANYVLARGLGASVDSWRMSLLDLTIHIKAFSLPESSDVYWGLTKALMALAVAVVCLLVERRVATFSAKLMSLYWALWSLVAFLRSLLFSTFFLRNGLASPWPDLPLRPGLKRTLGTLLLVLGLGLLLRVFRRGLTLGGDQLPIQTFRARAVAIFCLFCAPLLSASFLSLSRLPYFYFREAWPYLIFAPATLLTLCLTPAIWRIKGTGTATMPTRIEILPVGLATALLLAAIPISNQLERITEEHRFASHWSQHLWISYPPATIPENSAVLFSEAAESTYSRIAAKIPPPAPSSRIHFIFFSSAEEKLSRHGSAELIDFDLPRDEIRLIFIPPFDHFDASVLARFLLQKRFGTGRNPVLEAGLVCLLTNQQDPAAKVKEATARAEGALASVLTVEGPLTLNDLLFSSNPDSLSPFVTPTPGNRLGQSYPEPLRRR